MPSSTPTPSPTPAGPSAKASVKAPSPARPADAMPGAALERRQLHVFFVCDRSASMDGDKIASLNAAIVEALDALREIAAKTPTADVRVRAISFASRAEWHIPEPTHAATVAWRPLETTGTTDMAGAVSLLSEALDVGRMPRRGLPPVIVLVSDGQPDDAAAFDKAMKRLLGQPWGKRAVRVAVAIGADAHVPTLEAFIANPEVKVLMARDAAEIVQMIRLATVTATQSASRPVRQAPADETPPPNVF